MNGPDDPGSTRVLILSEEQIDHIADRVEDRFYERVGKTVVEKVLKVIGLVAAGLAVWLAGKGYLK